MLMALSTGVALAGIGIAWFFWLRNRAAADAMAQQFGGRATACCSTSTYVDELYDAADRAADQAAVDAALCGRASTPA